MQKIIVATVLVALAAAAWWWSSRDRADAGDGPPEQAAVTVLVQAAEPRRYADELEALGTIRASESVEITARVSSIVTEIHFTEGERVEAGAPLVALENSEARADYAEAQAALVEVRGQFTRSRELLRTNAVSESQVEQLEAQVTGDAGAN